MHIYIYIHIYIRIHKVCLFGDMSFQFGYLKWSLKCFGAGFGPSGMAHDFRLGCSRQLGASVPPRRCEIFEVPLEVPPFWESAPEVHGRKSGWNSTWTSTTPPCIPCLRLAKSFPIAMEILNQDIQKTSGTSHSVVGPLTPGKGIYTEVAIPQ